MHLGGIVHGNHQLVERLLGFGPVADGGEDCFGAVHVPFADGGAELFATGLVGGELAGLDRMQLLGLRPTDLVEPVAVAHQHLHHGQRPPLRIGLLHRHVVGGGQRHERVEALVVVTAKGSRVDECGRTDQLFQVGAGFELLQHRGEKLVRRRVLQQANERVELAEREVLGFVLGVETEPQIRGDDGTQGRGEHTAANIVKQFAASELRHGETSMGKEGENRISRYPAV